MPPDAEVPYFKRKVVPALLITSPDHPHVKQNTLFMTGTRASARLRAVSDVCAGLSYGVEMNCPSFPFFRLPSAAGSVAFRNSGSNSVHLRVRRFSFLRTLSLTLSLACMSFVAHARNFGNTRGTGQGSTATLRALSCSSGSMSGSGSDSCTVTLSGAAGSRGLVVSLSSNNRAVRVPSSVTVRSGSASAAFTASVSAFSGTQSVILTASEGGTSTTFDIQLSAGTPAITVQSTSVAFGDVPVNAKATQSVGLTSSGTAPLTIKSGSVAGSGFSGSGMSFPVTLNPNQSATLQLQFDPSAAGSANGSVTLSSNASNAPTVTITLSGTGTSGSYHVNLAWSAPTNSTDPVAGYNIYRAVAGSSSYQLMNASASAQTAFTDSSVQNGSNYTYYVESIDASGGASTPSGTVSVSVP